LLAGEISMVFKVSHDFDKISEGDANIFTLKDSGIHSMTKVVNKFTFILDLPTSNKY